MTNQIATAPTFSPRMSTHAARLFFMTADEAYQKIRSLLLDSGWSLPRARLEARLLLDDACQMRYAHLLQPDRVLDADAIDALMQACMELRRGQPLAYLTKSREFFGLPFRCDRRALIPRHETETLVEAAVARLQKNARPLLDDAGVLVADLGTGSGCIAVSIAHALPQAVVYATDASGDALDLARENARVNGVANRIEWVRGERASWGAPLVREGFSAMFDAVLSNPPYISQAEIETLPPQIREWEPRLALDGGEDGLDCYRDIAASCACLLKPDGFLMVELGMGQFTPARSIFEAQGWNVEAPLRDLAGIERVRVATLKTA